jgi:hypothetical protein
MMNRCYNTKALSLRPEYITCEVSTEWKEFRNFEKWFKENYNTDSMQGWHLDKDILSKGNKIYSRDTCCFVPNQINSVVKNNRTIRGILPIGISKFRGEFKAQISKKNKNFIVGIFSTPEEAFEAYKVAKKIYIKELAEFWRDKISTRAYQALINYKIEITD